MLDQEQLKQKLVQDYDYKESQVDDIIAKLETMDPALVNAFKVWNERGVMPDYPQVGDFTPLNAAMTYPDLKPPAIFTLLDWIRREPEKALQALYEEFGIVKPVEDLLP